jgi:hypothetical protein
MADVFVDGNTRAAFVASLSSTSNPTAVELTNNGILLQDTLTADGLMGFEADSAEVDTSPLSATFDTKVPGRDQFSKTSLRLKKQTGTDTIFNTLTKNTTGYIVIRRGVVSTTAWLAGQSVEVYPITCGREKRLTPTANSVEKYEIPTMVSSQPNLRATVA